MIASKKEQRSIKGEFDSVESKLKCDWKSCFVDGVSHVTFSSSLLTLSRVIAALGSPSSTHINFRDSKLTHSYLATITIWKCPYGNYMLCNSI